MDVALYTSDLGRLLLVPSCVRPPADAERLHGPLRLCAEGTISTVVDAALRARIEQDLDAHTYALVTVKEAKALLGYRHVCFRNRRLRFLASFRRPREDRSTSPARLNKTAI
jgi:hypothetical protein